MQKERRLMKSSNYQESLLSRLEFRRSCALLIIKPWRSNLQKNMQRALQRNGATDATPTASATVVVVHQPQPLFAMETMLSCLWIVTPLTATVSLLVVAVAMFTNQWLHTEEKMNNLAYNGTGEKDYLSKFTVSGLWMLCFTKPGGTLFNCSKIDYFSKEEYSPDPNDSTMAIPYAVTRAAAFFLSASLLLLLGYFNCVLGQCVRNRTLYTFVSGVVFIVTGLVMLFGLIMYISIFKSEVGSKLRPRSHIQPPTFDYWYGYSFLLYVVGLVATQLTGISSIFLFIYQIQYEWQRKQSNNAHYTKRTHGGGCKPRTTTTTTTTRFVDPNLYYPTCRRHPNAYVNSTSAIYRPVAVTTQRRYFFGKDGDGEEGENYEWTPPPPPPTISYRFNDDWRNEDEDLERGFSREATSNTVSTSADVVTLEEDYERNFNTNFDLDQPMALKGWNLMSGPDQLGHLGGSGGDTLRRTTPV